MENNKVIDIILDTVASGLEGGGFSLNVHDTYFVVKSKKSIVLTVVQLKNSDKVLVESIQKLNDSNENVMVYDDYNTAIDEILYSLKLINRKESWLDIYLNDMELTYVDNDNSTVVSKNNVCMEITRGARGYLVWVDKDVLKLGMNAEQEEIAYDLCRNLETALCIKLVSNRDRSLLEPTDYFN